MQGFFLKPLDLLYWNELAYSETCAGGGEALFSFPSAELTTFGQAGRIIIDLFTH